MLDLTKAKMSDVMTSMPRCIESHQPLEVASRWMDELKVRHLPVRESGKIVGVLSDRDVSLARASKRNNDMGAQQKVEDAMISSVLTVDVGQVLSSVASKMFERHIGSAVVTDNTGAVVGIFTSSDALRVLSGRV